MNTVMSQSPLNIEFDKLVEELLQTWHVPGLAIAVIDGASTFSKVSRDISLTAPVLRDY
jgi:hypothetical protein